MDEQAVEIEAAEKLAEAMDEAGFVNGYEYGGLHVKPVLTKKLKVVIEKEAEDDADAPPKRTRKKKNEPDAPVES